VTGIVVNVVVHHRVGAELKETTLKGVTRSEAEGLVESLGNLRSRNGCLVVRDLDVIQLGIPAQNIELVEIKGGTWT